jgi:prepilin-type N-terminal cleavage/methylation domain-containing protein
VKSQKGFTLIEVLAAVVILSVAALLLYTVFTNASLLSLRQQNQDVSLNIARMVVEEVRNNINEGGNIYPEDLKANETDQRQPINLDNLLVVGDQQTLFFPNGDHHEYQINIESLDFPTTEIEVEGQGDDLYTFDIDSNYRLIQVFVTPLDAEENPKGTSSTLEAYVNIGGAP